MLRAIAALVAAPLIFSACASNLPDDELAGESSADDAIDGKADGAADGAYTYFEVAADLRKCLSPVCGGFFVSRLNRSTTVCANGQSKASCYSPTLDWTESGLSVDQQSKLVAAANDDVFSAGVRAIVRGRFAPQSYPGHGNMGRFVVTEAWVSETDSVSDGVFAKVKSNHIVCITTPCPTLTEKGLNSSSSANISEIDWSLAGLSDHEIAGFQTDLGSAHGVLIAGNRYYGDHHAKGRTATAAYHMLANPPVTACYVGGCSGQVCSAMQGVITTCEWQPQYACYHDATCEAQADGSCGWTETPALDACLASH